MSQRPFSTKNRPNSVKKSTRPDKIRGPVEGQKAKYKSNRVGCGMNDYKYNQIGSESNEIKFGSKPPRGERADAFFVLKFKNLATSLTVGSIQPNARRERVEAGTIVDRCMMARGRKQRRRPQGNAGANIPYEERNRTLAFDFSLESV